METAKYARGSTITLSATFKDQGGDPMVPMDTSYPQVSLTDPTGMTVATGVAQQTTTPGTWSWEWAVSAGATLGPGWRILWVMVDLNRTSFTQTFSFELYDQIEATDTLDRGIGYLCMVGSSERLIYRSAVDPETLNLTVTDPDQDTFLNLPKASLQKVFAEGYYNFYYDTPALTKYGTYLILWYCRETVVSRADQTVQHLRIPFGNFWYILPYFRGFVDKLNKPQITPLSYTDSELYTYTERGLDFINGIHPMTLWTEANVPETVWSWWILASGWWALNARQLLEIEVAHDFQGQTVNLTYDKSSPLSEVISRWETIMWERFLPMKLAMYRRAAGPGVVAVRPYRLNYLNRVYKVGQSFEALQDFTGIMGSIGLT